MRTAPTLPALEHPLALRAWSALVNGPLAGLVLQPFWKALGFPAWRRVPLVETPTFVPQPPRPPRTEPWDRALPASQAWEAPGPSRVQALYRGYQQGRWTPVDVARAFLGLWQRSEQETPPLRAFLAVEREHVLAQARAAAERWEHQTLLGFLDGIPFGVKDEFHAEPYTTGFGLRDLRLRAEADATAVEAWRSAGGLLTGKTNMHTMGMGVTGFNPAYGTPVNPYAAEHAAGGSSSGSAVAVAAGLVPLALAADAGGSIRIPAAFCGVYGLKPTFGRVSRAGMGPLTWSIAHAGPMAATVRDLALGLAYLAGPDARDPSTWHQPPLDYRGWTDQDLSGLVIGVDPAWNQGAEEPLLDLVDQALACWSQRGARVQEVRLPDLEAIRLAHLVTIGVEGYHAIATWLERGGLTARALAVDVRSLLALARRFPVRDYVRAQQWRTRAIRHLEDALREVHVLVTPATGVLPPRLSHRARTSGRIDTTTLLRVMRFSFLANLTGHPALVVPGPPAASGLPRGLQLIGRYWEEGLLLRLAWVLEQHWGAPRPPARFYDLTAL